MSSTDLSAARAWLAEYGYEACMYPQAQTDGFAAAAIVARRAVADVSFESPYADHLDRTGPMILINQGSGVVQNTAARLWIGHQSTGRQVGKRDVVVKNTQSPASSLLAWRLIEAPADMQWLAALGILANTGGTAPLPDLDPSTLADLRRLIVLCRAPALLRGTSPKPAFSMLWSARTPQSALSSQPARDLARVLERVRDHGRLAARAQPKIVGSAALLEIDVPAFVQGQVAAAWATRLAPRPVIVANHGWQAHKVNYSIRSSQRANLDRWLADVNGPASGTRQGRPSAALAADGELSETRFERLTATIVRGGGHRHEPHVGSATGGGSV